MSTEVKFVIDLPPKRNLTYIDKITVRAEPDLRKKYDRLCERADAAEWVRRVLRANFQALEDNGLL